MHHFFLQFQAYFEIVVGWWQISICEIEEYHIFYKIFFHIIRYTIDASFDYQIFMNFHGHTLIALFIFPPSHRIFDGEDKLLV